MVTLNGNVTPGFPRVELFYVDGDGQQSEAMRIRVGQDAFDPGAPEGGGIEQVFAVDEAGDYFLSADLAVTNLDFTGNTGPGRFELILDGAVVDAVDLNGTLINPGQILRDTLEAELINLSAGIHTLKILVTRKATNSREIFQYIDNLRLVLADSVFAATQAVPEPSASIILLSGIAVLLS